MSQTPVKSAALAWPLGAIGIVIFGSTLPVTLLALPDFNPWFITFGRAVIAALASGIALLLLRRPFPRDQAPLIFVAGLFVTFGFPLLMAFALQTVPANHGGVVLGILPLLTAVFAAVFAGERLPALFWACAIAGAALVVAFSMKDSGLYLSAGDLWLIAAATAASLGYVALGRLSRVMPGWVAISWALVLTAPLTALGAFWSWQPAFAEAPASAWFNLLYLGLFSQFIGFFFWNTALALGGIARIGQIQLLQTFVTLGIAAWLNDEIITIETAGFAALIAIVVWIGSRARLKTV